MYGVSYRSQPFFPRRHRSGCCRGPQSEGHTGDRCYTDASWSEPACSVAGCTTCATRFFLFFLFFPTPIFVDVCRIKCTCNRRVVGCREASSAVNVIVKVLKRVYLCSYWMSFFGASAYQIPSATKLVLLCSFVCMLSNAYTTKLPM